MTQFSTTPFLAAFLGCFWLFTAFRVCARNGGARTEFVTALIWLGSLAIVGVAVSWLSIIGVFQRSGFFAVLPGFWVPMIPLLISGGMLLILPPFRRALWAISTQVPARAFVAVHALRIAALGGVLKGFSGLLPASFTLPVGIPDLVFGISAMLLSIFWPRGGLGPRALIAWNLIGIGVILPAPLLMQMGLPGPLYTWTSAPDARALFEFPMVLAPTLIVPIFIFTNAVHVVVLWLSMRGAERQHSQVRTVAVGSR